MTYDYIVVGSGVGGALTASNLIKTGSVLLIEKENYLGGCSGSFQRKGLYFNAGATTFNGLETDMPVGSLFKSAGITPSKIKRVKQSITVLHKGKTVVRDENLEDFLTSLQKAYPNKNHKAFFEKVLEINRLFYSYQDLYFNKSSLSSKLKTIISLGKLGFYLREAFLLSGEKALKKYYQEIDSDFLDFLDNQVLIVAQGKVKEINFLTLALALGYTFYDNYYVYGGLGKLFEDLLANVEVKLKERVTKVEKIGNKFLVETDKNIYFSKKVVLNSTVFDTDFVESPTVKRYYKKLNQDFKVTQGACVCYIGVKSLENLHHHYQIINDQKFSYSLSNSIFLSFPEVGDEMMNKNGVMALTVSTHTDRSMWEGINKEEYRRRKEILKSEILETICVTLGLSKEDIKFADLGTPITFKRFANRYTAGGIPTTMKNLKLSYPDPTTPLEGLYHVGDTVFAGQGWPGVAIGVKNLLKVLNG